MPPGMIPDLIPVEASDTLAYTPECLAALPSPPVFELRAVTGRDKRMMRRMALLAGVTMHTPEDIRDLIREELPRILANHEAFLPHLEEYWSALEDYQLQAKDDAEIGPFEYPDDKRAAINAIYDGLRRNSPRYANALADNADAADINPMLMVAVTVSAKRNLEDDKPWLRWTLQEQQGGLYFTLAGAEAMKDALGRLDRVAGVEPGTAWSQLFVACAARWRLSEEEVGNFESPSPSEAAPKSSEAGTDSAARGKSPASAKSRKKTSGA